MSSCCAAVDGYVEQITTPRARTRLGGMAFLATGGTRRRRPARPRRASGGGGGLTTALLLYI